MSQTEATYRGRIKHARPRAPSEIPERLRAMHDAHKSGESIKSIAARLGLSTSNVTKSIHRVREILRDERALALAGIRT